MRFSVKRRGLKRILLRPAAHGVDLALRVRHPGLLDQAPGFLSEERALIEKVVASALARTVRAQREGLQVAGLGAHALDGVGVGGLAVPRDAAVLAGELGNKAEVGFAADGCVFGPRGGGARVRYRFRSYRLLMDKRWRLI